MYAAAPTVHVRTADGVVRIQHGDPLPKDADEKNVERLLALGALTKTKPKAPSENSEG